MMRSEYDEEEDMWKLKPLSKGGAETMAKRPASAVGRRRPMCEYAHKAAILSGSYRFKGENILQVELDMPNRTTRDYEGPSIAPKIQAVLDAALEDEGDIDIDDSALASKTKKDRVAKKKSSTGSRLKSASSSRQKQPPEQMYPTSRGLVPK
jgi:kinesin family protein 3/17